MQRRDKNKVREIAKRYVRNGMNLSKAVKEVYDKPYNPNVLGVMTHRLRYSPEYIEAVKKELATFDKSLVNEKYVLVNLYELINAKEVKASDKVNALTLCAKILQLTRESTNNLAIFTDVSPKIEAMISKRVKSIDQTEQVISQKVAINTSNSDVSNDVPSV